MSVKSVRKLDIEAAIVCASVHRMCNVVEVDDAAMAKDQEDAVTMLLARYGDVIDAALKSAIEVAFVSIKKDMAGIGELSADPRANIRRTRYERLARLNAMGDAALNAQE